MNPTFHPPGGNDAATKRMEIDRRIAWFSLRPRDMFFIGFGNKLSTT